MGWVNPSWAPRLLGPSSYIKLWKELVHPKKGLINIQNTDNKECFKCCLASYWHPGNHHLAIIRKVEKDFARQFDFRNIKFSVKIIDIHNFYKNNCINNSISGYETK